MTLAGSITPDGSNKSRNDTLLSDDVLRRPATFLESTETHSWPDTRYTQPSFTPFSPNLVTLEDATTPKTARDPSSSLYNGGLNAFLGTESSNASYSVSYSRTRKEITDRAVSRPVSKSSLDGQAEADNLSATFTSLDLNNEQNHQQRQG